MLLPSSSIYVWLHEGRPFICLSQHEMNREQECRNGKKQYISIENLANKCKTIFGHCLMKCSNKKKYAPISQPSHMWAYSHFIGIHLWQTNWFSNNERERTHEIGGVFCFVLCLQLNWVRVCVSCPLIKRAKFEIVMFFDTKTRREKKREEWQKTDLNQSSE